jgi:hypothetical protein
MSSEDVDMDQEYGDDNNLFDQYLEILDDEEEE